MAARQKRLGGADHDTCIVQSASFLLVDKRVMNRTNYTGQRLDNKYTVEKLLGEGGMGAVYRARHDVLDRFVAVKFLHSEFTDEENMIRRFYREGQVAVAIRHKNIVDVLDVGVSHENEPYLVMEYLEGESLATLLKRTGPIALPAACAIIKPVLEALEAAHEKNIVHRDLKPDNIFIATEPNGSVMIKLIDFGISKILTDDTRLTHTGAMVGTPAFMSPEQIMASKDVDHRTDIYAVGVILYEMLAGSQPFKGNSYEAMVYSVVSDEPIPPNEAYPKFPDEAASLILQCLSKSPDGRPQSVRDLLEAIKKLSGYKQRKGHLKELASGISEYSVAGAVGPVRGSGEKAAAKVLADLSSKKTPTAWSRHTVKNKKRGIGWMGGLGAAVLLLIIFVLRFWPSDSHEFKSDNKQIVQGAILSVQDEKKSLSNTVSTVRDTIQLEIDGVPENATFFYADKQYPESPLEVEKSDKKQTLTVSAPGFQSWHYDIIPNKDYAFVVHMEAILGSEKIAEDDVKEPERTRRKKTKQESIPRHVSNSRNNIREKTPSKKTLDVPVENEPKQIPTGFKDEW